MKQIEIDSQETWWDYWHQQKDVVLDIIYSTVPQDQTKDLESWEETKDWEKLVALLNEAWWRLPDRPYIHSLPGFNPLCYLCSEEGVFQGVE